MSDAGHVFFVGVLNLKMYALRGVQLTRANGYINFSTCMEAWGFCNSIQLILFPGKPFGYMKKKIKINGDVAKCLKNGSRNGSLTCFKKWFQIGTL